MCNPPRLVSVGAYPVHLGQGGASGPELTSPVPVHEEPWRGDAKAAFPGLGGLSHGGCNNSMLWSAGEAADSAWQAQPPCT